MTAYIVLVLAICMVLFFCCIDTGGKISGKIMLILMFFIMAFVTTNVDIGAYISWYQQINSIRDINITDPAFGLLMYIAKLAGLDYYGFLIALTVAGLAFVTAVFYRKSDCPALVTAVYFALVFPTMTIQIRSFIAETILYILIADIAENEEFNIKQYAVTLAAAVVFHASSAFFILLIMMAFIKNRRKLGMIVAGAVALVPFSAVILSFVPIPMIQSKIRYYFISQRTSFFSGVFLYVLLYLGLTAFIYYVYKCAPEGRWKGRVDRLLQINIICIVACAMIVMFSSNFYRIIRTVMVADAIVLTNYFYETGQLRLKNRAWYALIIIGLFLVGNIMTGSLLEICTNNSVMSILLDLA